MMLDRLDFSRSRKGNLWHRRGIYCFTVFERQSGWAWCASEDDHPYFSVASFSSESEALDDLIFATRFLEAVSRSWLDHWGKSRGEDGQEVFVSEPYHMDPDDMEKIDQFAELLQLDWTLNAKSWHYPGHTFRVEFWPREPATV
jgi:hypothetical protein